MNYYKKTTQFGTFLIGLTLCGHVFAAQTAASPEANAGLKLEGSLKPNQGNFLDNLLIKNFNLLFSSMQSTPRSTHNAFKNKIIPLSVYLNTSWENGFERKVKHQNKYNAYIEAAMEVWKDADPLILKSLLIQESNMQSRRINRYGYAGLAQLGYREARHAGLIVKGKIDERLVPSLAIKACLKVMRQKADCLAKGVFAEYGTPLGDEYWKFIAAAYNAGEGTISRAMRRAYGKRKPLRVKFSDLLASPSGNIQDSPLYKSLPRHWPKRRKFKEIKEFAQNVIARARQQTAEN